MVRSYHRKGTFAWTVAAWVALIALVAVGGLFVLRHWHNRAAHETAAQAVAERGQWLAMSLALRAVATVEKDTEDGAGVWQDFSGLLRSLREVESDLEFVAVRRDGLTLFQEHSDEIAVSDDIRDYTFAGPVSIGRQRYSDGEDPIPVVTFRVAVDSPRSTPIELELGLRRRAVEFQEWPAAAAIESMYRLSLATMVICFGLSLGLVVIMARREERREQARRREEHLAFSGMLANGIVHDFRNPMSSLRLDAQMLAKEADRGPDARAERMSKLAGRMRHTLDRMEKVFEEFLVLARPGPERRERLDLGDCARECLELLAPRFEAAGVTTHLHQPEGDAPILASAQAVKRALLNILVNASQHAGPAGQVRIEVSRVSGKARADICDSGPGISGPEREQVFEMFYSTRPQGTGLGLFLARTAIENSGGTLVVAEPNGAGARLRMEFPLTEDAGP